MISDEFYRRFYPDDSRNGTRQFYDWIRQSLNPSHRVLNFGAGPPTRSPARVLRGEVAEVVGADIDPIVFENDEIDSAVLLERGRVELADSCFDMVISDFVLEHVEDPKSTLSEIWRLLKPGGLFFFRTPNLYHYVSLVSALSPHLLHRLVANKARGLSSDSHEPWPTYYRMNSRRRLASLCRCAGFQDIELRMIEPEPSYLKFHVVPFLVGVAYERVVNASRLLEGLRVNILGCVRK